MSPARGSSFLRVALTVLLSIVTLQSIGLLLRPVKVDAQYDQGHEPHHLGDHDVPACGVMSHEQDHASDEVHEELAK